MSVSGGSYKLKDAKGKTVRDKKVKEELDRILSAFSIQVKLSLNSKYYRVKGFLTFCFWPVNEIVSMQL